MDIIEQVLIKPVVTEKSNALSEEQNKYVFIVAKNANKLTIKKAIESMYNVSVEKVNTLIMPATAKVRHTKSGIANGKKKSYKKAIVSLVDGDTIDFYSNI